MKFVIEVDPDQHFGVHRDAYRQYLSGEITLDDLCRVTNLNQTHVYQMVGWVIDEYVYSKRVGFVQKPTLSQEFEHPTESFRNRFLSPEGFISLTLCAVMISWLGCLFYFFSNFFARYVS